MTDSIAPPSAGTFIALLAQHQGPHFGGKGTIECYCGAEVENDVGWARHIHKVLIDANMAVISLDGLLRICKTVAMPDSGDA